jgi:hypothetical protein
MTFDIKTDLRVQYEYPSGTWNSIQADTYAVDISRGIFVDSGVFARPDVGVATVTLSKKSLSDLLTTPAYKSNQNFRIQYYDGNTSTWEYLFYGLIQNVGIRYIAETKKLDITITANDFMKIILGTRLTNYSITGSSAARSFRNVMNALSTDVQAIDSRAVFQQLYANGSGTTQWATTWTDTTAGEILVQFLDAELGWLWSDKNSVLGLYATRNDINYLQGLTWLSTDLTVSNVHSTSSNHVCMDSIDLSYDSDAIVNKVKVLEGFTGATSTATNSTSVTNYGEQSGDFEVTFDNTGVSTLNAWAVAVATAATPKSIKSVSVPVIRDQGDVSVIARVDIADTLQIEFAAAGYTTLQEIYLVSRIGHTITADHWEMNIELWKGI